ncbi:hypothetical protein ACVWYH_001159 [Bradyrhizobium sp. GM24.11]
MLTSGTMRSSQRALRQGAARDDASATAVEMDDPNAILEPGFWMTALVAFLPTVAGCLYLFLTQG